MQGRGDDLVDICDGLADALAAVARRAADTAADLVDRVLPEARYRQWVLTFPWQMRYLLATDRAFQSAVLRTFLRTVGSWMPLRVRHLGLRGGQVGAVTFVHRPSPHGTRYNHCGSTFSLA